MTKNFRKFLLLWAAGLVSATGSGMTSFALGIYVYRLTGLSSWTDPVLATLILSISGARMVILFDVTTILLTLPVTCLVRRHMKNNSRSVHTSVLRDYLGCREKLYKDLTPFSCSFLLFDRIRVYSRCIVSANCRRKLGENV